ncbi:ribonuclease Z [Methanobrevibacter filiformis]|uniref:Ribonuclease Z n=1 Tax=Methanobrevibacter filiformis TaxID=55758 RepID=A0A166AH04_9EURY|nr:ribonuclease Z [Methanobrevibacter filiformis]KZX12022.1 ribonuclease Z [Methanobrevibacter filiformis]
MELIFLGTSSAIPSKQRNHPAIALKAFGEVILFDCGEGTQRQLAIAKISPMKINKIFISHLHGDHVLGLPGLIQSMDFRDRKIPLDIYGPPGLFQLKSAILRLGYCSLDFDIRIHELTGNFCSTLDDFANSVNGKMSNTKNSNNNCNINNSNNNNNNINSNANSNNNNFDNCIINNGNTNNISSINNNINNNENAGNLIINNDKYSIQFIKTDHGVCNLSYSFVEKKKPRFLRDKAIKLGVKPGPDFGKLHNGSEVKIGDRVVMPNDVLGEDRSGVKIVYSGDTRPNQGLISLAKDADLLIHESTYCEDDKNKAIENNHSTSSEAALIAKCANAKNLVLTHISTRYNNTEDILKEACELFKNTKVAYDFMVLNI